METVTVAPASDVPEIAGVLSAVVEPLAGAVIVGVTGAVTSTVKLIVTEAGERLPTASVAVALTV